MISPVHAEEAARLELIDLLRLSDAEPLSAVQEIVGLAARIARAPVALLTGLDREDLWLKGRTGVDAGRLPREGSFCAVGVAQDAPLILSDARQDPRFREQWAADPGTGFGYYLGIPVRVGPDRLPVGMLCVLDRSAREPGEDEQAQLTHLARLAEQELERRWKQARIHADLDGRARVDVRLVQVLETMNDGVVVHEASGAIVWSNPAAARILGLSEGQLMGRDSFDPRWGAVDEDGQPFPGEQHPAMVALRTGKPVSGVVMGVGIPESRRWVLVDARPYGSDGGVLVSFTDITEHRAEMHRRAIAERQVELFFDEHQEMLAVVRDGHFERMNQAWSGLLGWEPETLLGTACSDVLPEWARPEHRKWLERLARDGSAEPFEVVVGHSSGSPRTLCWTGSWTKGVILLEVRDVTVRISER